MKCLSCRQPLRGPAKFFRKKILLCEVCEPLADKAATDIDKHLETVREAAYLWLERHILDGGLLRAGSGMENIESEGQTP